MQFKKTVREMMKSNPILVLKEDCLGNQKRNYLFDFSLLDSLEIWETEKEEIMRDALENITVANRNQIVIRPTEFETFCAKINYSAQKVFNENGKLVYTLMTAVSCDYNHAERKSIYDKFYGLNHKTIKAGNPVNATVKDIEL